MKKSYSEIVNVKEVEWCNFNNEKSFELHLYETVIDEETKICSTNSDFESVVAEYCLNAKKVILEINLWEEDVEKNFITRKSIFNLVDKNKFLDNLFDYTQENKLSNSFSNLIKESEEKGKQVLKISVASPIKNSYDDIPYLWRSFFYSVELFDEKSFVNVFNYLDENFPL